MFHKRLLNELKENKLLIVGMVICQWVSLLANILFLWKTAEVIEQIWSGNNLSISITSYLFLVFLVFVIRSLSSTYYNRFSFQASSVVKQKMRTIIYSKLLRFGANYHEKAATSEIVQISTEGVEQLEIYFGKYVPQFFYSMLAPLTLFIIVGTISIKTAAILLFCVPLIPISIIAVQKFAKKLLNRYWGTYTELGDSFLENLQGLTTLKIFNADERYAKKMDEEAEKFRKVTMRVLIMQLNSISVMDLVAYGGAAIGILVSLSELRIGNISLAECFFILMVSVEFFLPLRLLGSFFHIAMNGNAAADKIFHLLDLEEKEQGNINEIPDDCIELNNLSFSYSNKKEEQRTVIQNITIELKEKQFAAIVGESGSGKSTIASLIMGEYENYQGEIKIGGISLKQLSESERMKKITRINHNSYLFKGTVMENLRMGNESASINQMEEALKQVLLYDFVVEQGGLNMELKEQGSNLSGGQRQRLAIARALLHDSDIYIFDEATSNIDVESENQIMQVIYQLAENKTVLLISHRLANVIKSDNIYVLEHGILAEQGIHQDLIKQQGIYAKLWNRQSELEQYIA